MNASNIASTTMDSVVACLCRFVCFSGIIVSGHFYTDVVVIIYDTFFFENLYNYKVYFNT